MPSSRALPSLDRSPKQNWVDQVGGLPDYIERIARRLHFERGMSISRAIATAISRVKLWAAGGGNVNADTRAKAARALAQWEAKKARARAMTADSVETVALAEQPDGYTRETEAIRERRKTPEARRAHRFRPAKWTHPNGHPRCALCGCEERIGGMCEGADRDEVNMTASPSLAMNLARWNPADHPRDPRNGKFVRKGTPLDALKRVVAGVAPGVELRASAHGRDRVSIDLIRVPESERGQGKAERAMRAITAAADRMGITLTLTPEPLPGDRTTRKSRLVQFYRRHGFVPNSGRNRDFEISDTMLRRPRSGADLAVRPTATVELATPDVATTATMVALYLPGEVAQRIAVRGGLPAEDLHVTLCYLGENLDVRTLRRALQAVLSAARFTAPLTGRIGGIGAFPPGDDGVPVWVPVDVPGLDRIRARIADEIGPRVARNHGFTPHITLTYLQEGQRLPAPVPATPVTFGALTLKAGPRRVDIPLAGEPMVEPAADADFSTPRRAALDLAGPPVRVRRQLAEQGKALPDPERGGRFPIRNRDDLKKAIRAVGRARPNTPEQRAKVRRFIIRRARELGALDLIPPTWAADGTLKGASA